MTPEYTYRARITRVIDGDTIEAEVDLGFRLSTHQRFRLLGLNCPETRGESRFSGLLAADYTRRNLEGREVVVRTSKSDSFDRWLATIYLDGRDFNAELLANGYAVPYP